MTELDDAVRSAVAEFVGPPVRVVGRTARGESSSSFAIETPLGPAIVKLAGDGLDDQPTVLRNQERLIRIVDDLRRRGAPVAEHLGVGSAGGRVFVVQRALPGSTLEVASGAPLDAETFRSVLPALLDAIELQRDAGDLADPPWPGWLLDTIDHGADGYCIHDTLRRTPATAALLTRLQRITDRQRDAAPPRASDVVHFDLNPANILHVDGRLTGVVDWTVPFTGAAQGDRGFDVATLLFYAYDVDATRHQLWARVLDISGLAWTAIYLAHLVLRQVEWSMRHRPGSAEEERFLGIAHRVLGELEHRGA